MVDLVDLDLVGRETYADVVCVSSLTLNKQVNRPTFQQLICICAYIYIYIYVYMHYIYIYMHFNNTKYCHSRGQRKTQPPRELWRDYPNLFRSKRNHPNPKDNALVRNEPSTCKGSTLHLQRWPLVKALWSGSGSICLLLATRVLSLDLGRGWFSTRVFSLDLGRGRPGWMAADPLYRLAPHKLTSFPSLPI